MRTLSLVDRLLAEIDQSMRTAHATPATTGRPCPADAVETSEISAALTAEEQKLSGRLMRINHAGEVAAQGLYRGQAMTAKLPDVREQMAEAAREENDHLAWCEQRLAALDSRKSLLNPLWYWGSFSIGAAAGLIGDRWSLGFVHETERQVEQHLDKHLSNLPANDLASVAVLKKMKEDEIRHGENALQAGAQTLPWPVRKLMMPLIAKAMTTASYRI